ncbi:hypothetical protein DENSPDRAFT_898453 [Dentipellis sp. KUC8613]|nr:hypothetical protein DENSPDRAFT_898453 [Dentipellis sp. KUC8613]
MPPTTCAPPAYDRGPDSSAAASPPIASAHGPPLPTADLLPTATHLLSLAAHIDPHRPPRARTQHTLVYLALSLHPITHALHFPVPHDPRSFTALPSRTRPSYPPTRTLLPLIDAARLPAAAHARAAAVAAMLWLIAHRYDAALGAALVSTAIEAGLLHARMVLKEHDAPVPAPPADTFAVLRAVARTTRAIVRAIRRRPRARRWGAFACLSLGSGDNDDDEGDDGDGPVRRGEENDAVAGAEEVLLKEGQAAYDPVRQPSAVLHPQDAVLVPATKMAAFVLECMIEDFGVGVRAPGRPCGVYVPWAAQLPLPVVEQQYAVDPGVPRMEMVESEAQMATRSQ